MSARQSMREEGPGGVYKWPFRKRRLWALYQLVVSVYHRRRITPEEFGTLRELRARVARWSRPEVKQGPRRILWNVLSDPCWQRCYDALQVGAVVRAAERKVAA